MKILAVDDYEDNLTVLGFYLNGHELTKCNSGKDAFIIIKKTKFDLAFIDLAMPDIDGYAVLKKIKEDSPQTYCVILSSYGFYAEERRKSIELGADDIATKPFSKETINKYVDRVHDRTYAEIE